MAENRLRQDRLRTRDHGIEKAEDFEGYRARLPKLAYGDLERFLEPVKEWRHGAFLPELPQRWVI